MHRQREIEKVNDFRGTIIRLFKNLGFSFGSCRLVGYGQYFRTVRRYGYCMLKVS